MKVAVLTAGGVAPGMNAVAQTAFSRGWEVVGVENGYGGLLEGRLEPVDGVQLGGLMRRGGTLLGTDRSKEVETDEGRERAVRRLEEAGVGGLVVIGGGESLTAARALHEVGVETVGIPATIDNDVPGTELAVDKGDRHLPQPSPHRQGYGQRLRLPGGDERNRGWDRGNPTATDRILAARLGADAVEARTMIGARGEKTERIPLSAVVGEERPLDPAAYRLAQILAEMPG